MADATVVFRLRFVSALAAALVLLLAFGAREAISLDAGASEYIVQMEPGSTPEQGQALAVELGGQPTSEPLPVINGFGAVLDDDAAEELEGRPEVREVTLNAATSSGTDAQAPGPAESGGYACPTRRATSTKRRRAQFSSFDVSPLNAVRRMRQAMNFTVRGERAWQRATGSGVGVAVIDTGIAGDLPDFTTAGRSRVIATAVTNPCASDATDHVGHGTHVAGLIAGHSLNQRSSDDDDDDDDIGGRYMGVAPKANLVSVKVSDDEGATTVLDVIHGLQFVIDYKDELGIRVVNLSLSSTVPESYRTDPLDAAVEAAWFAGIVVVAAAGNEGGTADAVSYAPGNDPFIISVGALDDRGSKKLGDDRLAPWSSRGLTQDGVRKPDLLAPGTRVIAPLAPNSDFQRICSRCVLSKRYFRLSGTSMSSAVVSGAAALVLEANPAMTPDQVKGALVSTLREVPGVGGAIDANAALDGAGSVNTGLVPSALIDEATGMLDWTRASFRRASFRDAVGPPFGASWARASFRCDCGLDASGQIDTARASFRRVSFRRTVDFDR